VKSILKAILLPAAVLCTMSALTASSHAQTTFNAIGSSALFLELGEAAYSNNSASCAWSTSTKDVVATDTSTGSSLSDAGTAWAVWVPSSGNTCASNATPAAVYGYLNVDSVVGNRCLFNANAGGLCSISYSSAAGTSPSGLIEGATEVSLPAAVASSLTSSTVNAAGTDIRNYPRAHALRFVYHGNGWFDCSVSRPRLLQWRLNRQPLQRQHLQRNQFLPALHLLCAAGWN